MNCLWIGVPFDQLTAQRHQAVSHAASVWQNSLITALIAAGWRIGVRGHMPAPHWPRGPFWVSRGLGTPCIPEITEICSYLNTPVIRSGFLCRSYRRLALEASRQQTPDVVVTYNGDDPQRAAARRTRELVGCPWVCVVADGTAPDDADGYAFLSWDYYKQFPTTKTKMHLDGGVSKVVGEPNPEALPRRIVFAGGMGEHAGATALVHAFSAIQDRSVELVLCGKGDNSTVKEHASRDSRIRALGLVDDVELDRIARSAWMFINPRPTGHGPNRLNFPSKILTYLAYTKPVISTRCAGLSPDYDAVLTFVEEEDVQSLSNKMKEVLSWSAGQRQEVTGAIAEFAKSHRWEAQALKLIDFVETLAPVRR